jgi:hypothetical protein
LKVKPNLEGKVYLKTYYHHERKYVLEIMIQKGENTIRGAKGAKVKVFFQGLHMTCVFVLVYNFQIYIFSTSFKLHFKYKYVLTTHDFISCRLCIHALYHINMNDFY